jgi:hypothetical protein
MIPIPKSELLTKSKIFESMPSKLEPRSTTIDFKTELREHDHDLGQLAGWMFEGLLLLVVDSDQVGLKHSSSPNAQILPKPVDSRVKRACNIARFAGADITADLADEKVTHIVIVGGDVNTRLLREKISKYVCPLASRDPQLILLAMLKIIPLTAASAYRALSRLPGLNKAGPSKRSSTKKVSTSSLIIITGNSHRALLISIKEREENILMKTPGFVPSIPS